MNRNVTSLETAQKLKEAGFPQESAYEWAQHNAWHLYIAHPRHAYIAAPTAQELADELPYTVTIWKQGPNPDSFWGCKNGPRDSDEDMFGAPTIAEALAALWLAIHEKDTKS
jgi:hypothetical protein